MTLRSNGSYIGPRPAGPSTSVASGIWDLRTAERQRRAAAWPVQVVTDPDFASVSLLLHMDGSGSTFTDSSASPKTVTASGDANQSIVQSKFGAKSAAFDGVGDVLAITSPASSLIDWSTQSFTVECWVYPTNLTASSPPENQWPYLCGNMRATQPGDTFWAFGTRPDGTLRFYYWNGVAPNAVSSSSGAVTENSWHHIAFTHSSGTIKIYVNGTEVASGSVIGTPVTSSSEPFSIGAGWHGYVDDFRVTAGVARTITVPTAAFPNA